MSNPNNFMTSQASSPLSHTLQLLGRLYPPAAVIHIGAGNGHGELHSWQQWVPPNALLIDAEEEKMHWVDSLQAQHPAWKKMVITVAANDGETSYFFASNNQESGLISTDILRGIWPNLSQKKSETRQTITIDTIVRQHRIDIPDSWLIIDCNAANDILAGAASMLPDCDVVICRSFETATSSPLSPESWQTQAATLQKHGFAFAGFHTGNHPQTGHAVFCRSKQELHKIAEAKLEQLRHDWNKQETEKQQQLLTQTAQLGKQQQQISHLEQKLNSANQIHNEQQILAANLQKQLEQAHTEGANLAELAEERLRQLARAQQSHNEKQTLTVNLQQQLEQAHTESANLAELAEERLQQLMRAQQSHNEQQTLAANLQQQLEQAHTESANLAELAEERLQQLARAQQSHNEKQTLTVNLQQQLEQAHTESANLAELAEERLQQLMRAQQSHNEQQTLAANLQQQLEQAHTESANLAELAEERLQQLARAQQSHNEQQTLAANLHQQLEQAHTESANLAELAEERLQQLARAQQSHNEQQTLAANLHQQLEQAHTESANLTELAEERLQQLARAQQSHSEQQTVASSFQQQLEQLKNEITKKTTLIKLNDDKIKELESALDISKSNLINQNAKHSKFEKDIAELKENNKLLEIDKASTELILKNRDAEIKSLSTELAQNEFKQNILQDEIKRVNIQVELLIKLLSDENIIQ